MKTTQESRKENIVPSRASKIPKRWFRAVLWPLLTLSFLILGSQIRDYIPSLEAKSVVEAVTTAEPVIQKEPETVAELLPVDQEQSAVDEVPQTQESDETTEEIEESLAEEVIPDKDYLEEARSRFVLYEELAIDPTAPTSFEDQELDIRLAELAEFSNEYDLILQNRNSIPDSLLEATCNYPEMIDFTLNYLNHGVEECAYTATELEMEYPLFIQWDKRWGYLPYGQNCLAISGCAPTCLAMIIVALTKDETITPNVVGDYSMKMGYYVAGAGSTWALLREGASHFGLKATPLSHKAEVILKSLSEGKPIICSMRKGYFTARGHFIALVGIDEEGKIIVNDPNSVYRSSIHWDVEDIVSQVKGMWNYVVKGDEEDIPAEEPIEQDNSEEVDGIETVPTTVVTTEVY